MPETEVLKTKQIFRRTFDGENLDVRVIRRKGQTTIAVFDPAIDGTCRVTDTESDTQALKAG